MHHESETSGEIQELMDKLTERVELGPTGRFPEGKLTENDEGEIVFAVAALKGKVVVNFGSPVASLGMSPNQALKLAQLLRRYAKQIRSPQRSKR